MAEPSVAEPGRDLPAEALALLAVLRNGCGVAGDEAEATGRVEPAPGQEGWERQAEKLEDSQPSADRLDDSKKRPPKKRLLDGTTEAGPFQRLLADPEGDALAAAAAAGSAPRGALVVAAGAGSAIAVEQEIAEGAGMALPAEGPALPLVGDVGIGVEVDAHLPRKKRKEDGGMAELAEPPGIPPALAGGLEMDPAIDNAAIADQAVLQEPPPGIANADGAANTANTNDVAAAVDAANKPKGRWVCAEPGCAKRPSYSQPAAIALCKVLYCAAHAKPGMVRVVRTQLCAAPDCTRQPVYNWPAPGAQRKWCSLHMEPGMAAIHVSHVRCKVEGCERRARCKHPGGKVTFCSKHKEPGMVTQ